MSMIPAAAVIATWLVLVAWLIVLGGFAGALARPRVGILGSVRISLWTGLAVLLTSLIAVNFILPLKGRRAVVALGLVTLSAVAAWIAIEWRTRRARATRGPRARPFPWWVLVVLVALGAGLVVLAHVSFGPIDNWDVGLYHLNSIQYAAEYHAIPGLANLNSRLGTNISSSLLAAFLGNSGWGLDALRLVVGAFAAMFAAEIGLRLVDRGSRLPGTVVLVTSAVVAWPFLFSDPAMWVTSPTPDTIALLLGLVAGSYLVDALVTGSSLWGSAALMTATVAATVRTQLWVLAGLTVVVLLAACWRRRDRSLPRGRPRAMTVIAAMLSGALLLGQLTRDAVLSGWLLFPVRYLPLPVDWRVHDPSAVSDWIMSWARDPQSSPDVTLSSWTWVLPWAARTLHDWAVLGMIGLFTVAALALLFARGMSGTEEPAGSLDVRPWALALVPALGTLVAWFVTAPDPRFASAALILTGAIPASYAMLRVAQRLSLPSAEDVVALVAAGALVLVALPAAVSGLADIRGSIAEGWVTQTYVFGPVTVVASVNAVPVVGVAPLRLDNGGFILRPTTDDRCWSAFPLCTPSGDTTLRFRGDAIADGFRPGP